MPLIFVEFLVSVMSECSIRRADIRLGKVKPLFDLISSYSVKSVE